MNALIPVAPQSVDPFGGLVLIDPRYESERIGEYAGYVTKINIVFETQGPWRLCIAPRHSIDRVQLLNSDDVKDNDNNVVDLIDLLGHPLYLPMSDVLILETREQMSRCITYLSRESDIQHALSQEAFINWKKEHQEKIRSSHVA
ncbi:hypothetical protein OAP14_02565 [Aliiglaciecola sp.]|nr:hypothetical protein [Aliiglaciecola sp.]